MTSLADTFIDPSILAGVRETVERGRTRLSELEAESLELRARIDSAEAFLKACNGRHGESSKGGAPFGAGSTEFAAALRHPPKRASVHVLALMVIAEQPGIGASAIAKSLVERGLVEGRKNLKDHIRSSLFDDRNNGRVEAPDGKNTLTDKGREWLREALRRAS